MAELSNDDDLYDGVSQLIEDLWEKKAKEIIKSKLIPKEGFGTSWFSFDEKNDTIVQAFEDAGYEF